jgi:hypothetical protein
MFVKNKMNKNKKKWVKFFNVNRPIEANWVWIGTSSPGLLLKIFIIVYQILKQRLNYNGKGTNKVFELHEFHIFLTLVK